VNKRSKEDDGLEECEITVRNRKNDLTVLAHSLANQELINDGDEEAFERLNNKIQDLKDELASYPEDLDAEEDAVDPSEIEKALEKIARVENVTAQIGSRMSNEHTAHVNSIHSLKAKVEQKKLHIANI